VIAITVAVSLPSAVAVAPGAGADIASDAAQIAQLESHISAEGAHIKTLTSHYNDVQRHLHDLDARIARAQSKIAADRRKEDAAMASLQSVAVRAYVTGVELDSPTVQMFSDTTSLTGMLEQSNYLGVVNRNLSDALDEVHQAREQTQRDMHDLDAERSAATATLRQLKTAKRAADAAIAFDRTVLGHVNADLRLLLAIASAREAGQIATERALAALPSAPRTAPPAPIPLPTPGTYANPLRDILGLYPERIDQGVDFTGFGSIYAIGDGVVLATTVPGWPGGTMIAYQLIDGPANGLVVYAAEDILPNVQVGDIVNSNTILGVMYPGPDGIETGWGDPSTIGNTMARTFHQFDGANTTAFGDNFSRFLVSLGAPAGIPHNSPPTGSLPQNWPHWDAIPH